LDQEKNPFLARIQLGLFMAESRTLDEIIGAIAVWIDDRAAASRSAGRVASFGMFEVINEEEVAASLLEAAELWTLEHLPEASGLRGPFGLDPFRSPGLLVDGYDRKPGVLMPYNPPYYAELIESAGCEPSTELLAYPVDLATLKDPSDPGAARLQSEARAVQASHHLIVRDIREESEWRTIIPELERESSGAAWLAGPESPALTTAELLLHLKRIDARLPSATMIAARTEENGGALAFGAAVPNIRDSSLSWLRGMALRIGPLRMSQRGHSAPWELWAGEGMASRAARKAGIRLMPAIVRMDCRGWGMERLLLSELLTRTARQGHTSAEISPVPAGDTAARSLLAALGAGPYKTYHIYEKRF
jgi:hypothetical protein